MIILVRHGEATHHTQHLTGGWTDSDLTETGRGQLRALADKLAHDFNGKRDKFRILTSDLKRAVESAEIIAAKLVPLNWAWQTAWSGTNFCAKKITGVLRA